MAHNGAGESGCWVMEAADWIRDDLLWSPLPCSCSVVGRWHDGHSAAMMVITHLSHDWPATQSPGESIAFKYLNDGRGWSNESVPPGYWPAAGKPCCLKGQRFQSMQLVRGCCEGIISPCCVMWSRSPAAQFSLFCIFVFISWKPFTFRYSWNKLFRYLNTWYAFNTFLKSLNEKTKRKCRHPLWAQWQLGP